MRDFSVIAIFERKFFYMSEEIEIKDEVLDLKVTETYRREPDPGPRGSGSRPQAPGHVHRLDLGAQGLHHLVYEVGGQLDRRGARRATAPHIDVTIEQGDNSITRHG